MKILIVSISDLEGGAARAAYRLHHALKIVGIFSSMLVLRKKSDECDIASPFTSSRRRNFRIKRGISGRLARLMRSEDSGLRSLALFPSPVVDEINKSDCDLVNIHWACDEYLSIEDICRINRPVVITMHDMWYFTGAAHYSSGDYWMDKVAESQGGFRVRASVVDRWMMWRKQGLLSRCDSFVSPSQWLTGCARESKVLGGARLISIPNALDVEKWTPISPNLARKRLSIPIGKHVVLFGAIGGGSDLRKGADLMLSAIAGLDRSRYHVVVFGQSKPDDSMPAGLVDQWLGSLSTDDALIEAYSAADVFVMSSRMENYPNTCVEAQACGVPVAGFAIGGVTEIVADGVTGKLASPFDTHELTAAIEWCAMHSDGIRTLIRDRMIGIVDRSRIGSIYRDLFEEVIVRWQSKS